MEPVTHDVTGSPGPLLKGSKIRWCSSSLAPLRKTLLDLPSPISRQQGLVGRQGRPIQISPLLTFVAFFLFPGL
jgi:hypothetical protein